MFTIFYEMLTFEATHNERREKIKGQRRPYDADNA